MQQFALYDITLFLLKQKNPLKKFVGFDFNKYFCSVIFYYYTKTQV